MRRVLLASALLAGSGADAWMSGGGSSGPSGPEGAPSPQGARMSLYSLEGYENAVCADNSPAGYYFREGSGSGSSVWVVFLEGVRANLPSTANTPFSGANTPLCSFLLLRSPPAAVRGAPRRLTGPVPASRPPARASGAGTSKAARSASRRSRREWGRRTGPSIMPPRVYSATPRRAPGPASPAAVPPTCGAARGPRSPRQQNHGSGAGERTESRGAEDRKSVV